MGCNNHFPTKILIEIKTRLCGGEFVWVPPIQP